jgi:diadenosine tetraphosphate (Ap4A) HIT family hydrolase
MIRYDREEALEQLEAEHFRTYASQSCMMCELAEGGPRVAESQHAVAVLDGFAATVGHLLVIARHHVERPSELDWPVYSDIQRVVWEATRTVERILTPSRVYTAALGAAVDVRTSFPHFHVHVVPVYATDERARPAHVFSWSSGVVRYEADEAARLTARLRSGWVRTPLEPSRQLCSSDDRTAHLTP